MLPARRTRRLAFDLARRGRLTFRRLRLRRLRSARPISTRTRCSRTGRCARRGRQADGEGEVVRLIETSPRSWMHSHNTPVTVESGRTTYVTLGDNGALEWLSTGRLNEVLGIDIAANNAALWTKFGAAVTM